MPLHPFEINIYDACLQKWGKKFDSDKGRKTHCSLSSARLCAMWVQGQRVGVLVATYICITYRRINVVTRMFDKWAGERGALDPPTTLCFSGLTWHLASSRLNWQLLWTAKWPCVIPAPVSKPSPDSWMVNSTRKLIAKRDVCCQSGGSSHVETPGKVTRLEEVKRGRKRREVGWRCFICNYSALGMITCRGNSKKKEKKRVTQTKCRLVVRLRSTMT